MSSFSLENDGSSNVAFVNVWIALFSIQEVSAVLLRYARRFVRSFVITAPQNVQAEPLEFRNQSSSLFMSRLVRIIAGMELRPSDSGRSFHYRLKRIYSLNPLRMDSA